MLFSAEFNAGSVEILGRKAKCNCGCSRMKWSRQPSNERGQKTKRVWHGERAVLNDVMKRILFSVAALAAVISLSSCATKNASQTGKMPAYNAGRAPAVSSTEPLPAFASASWPLMFSEGSETYTIFEPQSDSWDGHELTARSAVGIRLSDQTQPIYGTISFKAITLVDKTKQTATLAAVKIESVDFPSAHGQTQDYLAVLRKEFPKRARPLPIDHLESGLAISEQHPKSEPLNNTPPKVIIATGPAVLVSIDGPPIWRTVPGTDLSRAINTRVLLLNDQSGKYYLHLFDGYLEASSLDGRWSVASQRPPGSEIAERLAVDSAGTDLMEGEGDNDTQTTPSLKTSLTPDVFVETAPAELITFSGPPQFAPISGTELVYAANTSANVFKLLTDQQNYILISGRWYSAPSLNGPWRFVPGNQLPRDFAGIPDTSPKENVKASVPGTQQAQEALIANSIPEGASVPRDSRMDDPVVDGSPQLAPIQDTLLHYVINSSTPIIEVNPKLWYACQNGVWYVSGSVNGPWVAATYVSPAIYTIPTTSPLHYLTYVQVYGSSPDAVYEGYTPGYLGTEVADDGTVVYGTGYYYAPWVGAYWYGWPCTWGYGFDYCWTPWWGWSYSCGCGWGCWGWGPIWWGFFPPFPFFGGFGRHHHDGSGGRFWANRGNTGANLYRHDGPFSGAERNGQFVRLGGDYGRAYNSRTGQIAAGQPGRVRNVSGGAWDPTRGLERYNGYRQAGGENIGRGPGVYGMSRGFNGSPRSGGFYRESGGYAHGGGGGGHGGGGGGGHDGGGGGGGGHGGGGGGGGGGSHGK